MFTWRASAACSWPGASWGRKAHITPRMCSRKSERPSWRKSARRRLRPPSDGYSTRGLSASKNMSWRTAIRASASWRFSLRSSSAPPALLYRAALSPHTPKRGAQRGENQRRRGIPHSAEKEAAKRGTLPPLGDKAQHMNLELGDIVPEALHRKVGWDMRHHFKIGRASCRERV